MNSAIIVWYYVELAFKMWHIKIGSYSVFRLRVSTDLVVVETRNIHHRYSVVDIPSRDTSRNIFHEILRVSTPVRWPTRNMLSRNMKIFRVSTPHKEWPYFLFLRGGIRRWTLQIHRELLALQCSTGLLGPFYWQETSDPFHLDIVYDHLSLPVVEPEKSLATEPIVIASLN